LSEDIKVVDPLLGLLHDPSQQVAEKAADGLHKLGPQIQKDRNLSARVAQELRATLESHSGVPGSAPLRAALVDAMGTLKDPDLRRVYESLLQPAEVVPVRRAAIRALAQLDQPGVADDIVGVLDDPNDEIRLEALTALSTTTTANFSLAEKLYSVLINTQEKDEIRNKAWEVLDKLFRDPNARDKDLFDWADRFKAEPQRRIDILQVLQDRFNASKDEYNLATVRQDLGEDKMKLADAANRAGDSATAIARATEAANDFDLALQYFVTKPDSAMVTTALVESNMDALLASKQYTKAGTFASQSIARDAGNQEALGRKLYHEIDRLRNGKDYKDALQLIDVVNQMNPKLADQFLNPIKGIEADIHQKTATTPPPQSAADVGQ